MYSELYVYLTIKKLVTQIESCSLINYKYKLKGISYKARNMKVKKINVFKGILDNYVFVGVISATVFFQIIIVEYLGTFANTTPLTLSQWFFCLLVGFMGMPIAARLKKIPV